MPTQRRNSKDDEGDDDDSLGALMLQGMWTSLSWGKRKRPTQ